MINFVDEVKNDMIGWSVSLFHIGWSVFDFTKRTERLPELRTLSYQWEIQNVSMPQAPCNAPEMYPISKEATLGYECTEHKEICWVICEVA